MEQKIKVVLKDNNDIKLGERVLYNGEIGILILAGGMGTRLGYDIPKCMVDIGKTKKVYIIERIIENILIKVRKYNKYFPLFIMTSNKYDLLIKSFLREKNYFGYNREYIIFFTQNDTYCVDENDMVVGTSSNGNGECFKLLLKNEEAIKMINKCSLKYINVISIDNVLVDVLDPSLLSYMIEGNYDIGAKVIENSNKEEKVGVLGYEDGRICVVENVDIKDGEYNYAMILNYIFSLSSILRNIDYELTKHKVKKKMLDKVIYKDEYFITDYIKIINSCIPMLVDRDKEFAPIKNKEGVDSIKEAHKLLIKNNVII